MENYVKTGEQLSVYNRRASQVQAMHNHSILLVDKWTVYYDGFQNDYAYCM